MKLLITVIGLAVLACACGNDFTAAQKLSKKEESFQQTFFSGNQGQADSFSANTSNYIFINAEKPNPIVLTEKVFIPKNNTPVTGSINVEKKEMTTTEEMVLNKRGKQSHNHQLFSAVDFLFGSLILVN